MKVFVKAPEELLEGVKLLGQELGYTLCEEKEAELVIVAEKSEESIVKVDLAGGTAKVVYGGGIIGKIVEIKANRCIVENFDGSRNEVLTNGIVEIVPAETADAAPGK